MTQTMAKGIYKTQNDFSADVKTNFYNGRQTGHQTDC